MKKDSINITSLLLKSKRVNNYARLMIILSRLNYYDDNYIPNAKLMKMLGINKKRTICLLQQLKEDRIIDIFYKGRKRYFMFIADDKKNKEDIIEGKKELFDYDWLNGDDEE